MHLGELFANAGLFCPENLKKLTYTGIVTNSRKVTSGSIFVAVRGQNNDGHDYINEAIQNGAVLIVAEQMRDGCVGGAAIILVENTSVAAALLYNAHHNKPSNDLKIIGVTGTNGKTGVCYMLESIFSAAGHACAVIGTLGCRALGAPVALRESSLTTPDSSELYPLLANLRDMGVTHVFMEVSSHALALHRVDGIEFECGVFTNLSRDHLDFHGTLEDYFLSKAKLFDSCKRAVINIDDTYGKRLYDAHRGSFAFSRLCGDAMASNVRLDFSGCSYTLEYKNKKYNISLGALGDFSVSNSLAAASVALELGISPYAVSEGLSRFFGVEGRMQNVTPAGAPFCAMIDFAHTPDALERLLLCVRELKGAKGRIITLFGCGGERDKGKRRDMGLVASKYSDFVIVTSDNSRGERAEDIISDILKGIDKEKAHKVIVSRQKAIEYAVLTAGSGDIILLCGKGHEKYIIDADGTHPFDEEKILNEAYVAICK